MTVLERVENSIAIRSGVNFSAYDVATLDNGNVGIQGLRIFRAGTFRDSLGIQRTWEKAHLAQMVSNFQMLRDEGKFVNVPVREDHSSSMRQVVGYLANLEADADGFLLGDIEFTVPDAKEKLERGHWRSRSLEVGAYETNEESLYWPVVMGLAFVDIPAVEGLHSRPKARGDLMQTFSQYIQDDDKESLVAEEKNTNTETEGTEAPETPVVVSDPETPNEENPEVAQSEEEEPDTTPVEATDEGGPQAQHGRVHTFNIAGRSEIDYAAVQRHIDTLETFQRETNLASRRDFVSGLASTNRIAATQVDGLTAHALGLSDEQFAVFRTAYESAPVSSLFANHGGQLADPVDTKNVADEIEVLEGTIAMHKRSGMKQEQIEKTDSFIRLQELKSNGNAV